MSTSILTEPFPRNDELGNLVRRLLGDEDEDVPPDLTALVPLFDELAEQNLHRTAETLQEALGHLTVQFMHGRNEMIPPMQAPSLFIRQMFGPAVGHLRFDRTSMVTFCAQQYGAMMEPAPELEQRKVELDTVRVPVPYPVERGMRIQMPDGRRGLVVGYADGHADVMPMSDEPGPTGEGMLPMPFPRRR